MMPIAGPTYFSVKPNDPSSAGEQPTREVCISNISPLERQRRLRFGIIQFAITLMILGGLIALHVNPLWRLPLLLLFWAEALFLTLIVYFFPF